MKRWLILLLAATITAACGPAATPEPTDLPPTATPEITPTPTPTATDAPTPTPDILPTNDPTTRYPTDYDIYWNNRADFEIGYPQGWNVTPTENVTYLTSFSIEDTPDTQGIPEGETKVDILTFDDPLSVEEWIAETTADNDTVESQVVETARLQTFEDQPGALLTIESTFGTNQVYYTQYQDIGIQLTAFGDLTPFERIIETLQPAASFTYGDQFRAALAPQLDQAAPDDITIRHAYQVEWRNACLDAAQPDEACAEVITPGWDIRVEVDGEILNVHTNLTANEVRIVTDEG